MLSRNGVLSLVNEFAERYTGGIYKSTPPVTIAWAFGYAPNTDTDPIGLLLVITDTEQNIFEFRSIPFVDLAAYETFDAMVGYIDTIAAQGIRSLQKYHVRST